MNEDLKEIQDMNDAHVRECISSKKLMMTVFCSSINARHVKTLSSDLRELRHEMYLRGKMSLVVVDNLILKVNYYFADKEEARKADEIYEAIEQKCLERTEASYYCCERETILV